MVYYMLPPLYTLVACIYIFYIHTFLLQVLKLSNSTIKQLSIGHLVNLASNDVHRFDGVINTVLKAHFLMFSKHNISRSCTV